MVVVSTFLTLDSKRLEQFILFGSFTDRQFEVIKVPDIKWNLHLFISTKCKLFVYLRCMTMCMTCDMCISSLTILYLRWETKVILPASRVFAAMSGIIKCRHHDSQSPISTCLRYTVSVTDRTPKTLSRNSICMW